MEGCILTTTSASWPSNSDYATPFDSELAFGSESFWDAGTPNQLVIPAGVNGELVEFFGMTANSSAGSTTVDGKIEVTRLLPSVQILTGIQYDNLRWSPFGGRTGLYQVTTAEAFRLMYRTFGVTGSCIQSLTRLGCIVNPQDHLLGAVHAFQAANVSLNGGVTLTWDTPDVDTAGTHDGTTGFVAPTGAQAAVVSCHGQVNPGSTDFSTWNLRKNGTTVARMWVDSQFRIGGAPTFMVDVAPGDILTIFADHNATSLASETNVNIEWYG